MLLRALLVRARGGYLAGDGHYRGAIPVGVCDSGDKGPTGPETSRKNSTGFGIDLSKVEAHDVKRPFPWTWRPGDDEVAEPS